MADTRRVTYELRRNRSVRFVFTEPEGGWWCWLDGPTFLGTHRAMFCSEWFDALFDTGEADIVKLTVATDPFEGAQEFHWTSIDKVWSVRLNHEIRISGDAAEILREDLDHDSYSVSDAESMWASVEVMV